MFGLNVNYSTPFSHIGFGLSNSFMGMNCSSGFGSTGMFMDPTLFGGGGCSNYLPSFNSGLPDAGSMQGMGLGMMTYSNCLAAANANSSNGGFFQNMYKEMAKMLNINVKKPDDTKDNKKDPADATKLTPEDIDKKAEELAKQCKMSKENIAKLITTYGLEEAKKMLDIKDPTPEEIAAQAEDLSKKCKMSKENITKLITTYGLEEAKKMLDIKEPESKNDADAKKVDNSSTNVTKHKDAKKGTLHTTKNQHYALVKLIEQIKQNESLGQKAANEKAVKILGNPDKIKVLADAANANLGNDYVRSAIDLPLDKANPDKPLTKQEKQAFIDKYATDSKKGEAIKTCFSVVGYNCSPTRKKAEQFGEAIALTNIYTMPTVVGYKAVKGIDSWFEGLKTKMANGQ